MENSKAMLAKQAIVQTTHTPGWQHILNIAKGAVRQAEEAVWSCTDRAIRDDLVIKAQAAREFLDAFLRSIEAAKQVESDLSESFVEINY